MNKRPNPFFPQQATYPNPPLPPGLPPQQPQQYDYSGYWAAAQAAQQPGLSQPIPQWNPQAAPGPSGVSSQVPTSQSSLYANYGYGGQQNFNWQRQAQQQRQPFPIPQAPAQQSQPYFPSQQQHPPSAQPGRPFPTSQSFPQPPPPYRPQQPMFHQQPPQPQHSPPHLPPAKRPRFEGPSIPHPTSITSGHGTSGHAMGRSGINAVPGGFSNSPRGGGPSSGPGSRGGPPRGRGGAMGIGGGPSIGMMRGGILNNAGTRGGRGGHGPNGRGSHSGGQSGGHRGGRGGWHSQSNHNRRGATGGSRGRGSGYAHTNHARDGGGIAKFNAPGSLTEKDRSGKKEEIRQTLTDFRIIGLEIESLDWRWGSCNITSSDTKDEDNSKVPQPTKGDTEAVDDDSKLTLTDGVEEIVFGSAIKDTEKGCDTEEVPEPLAKTDSMAGTASEELGKDSHTPAGPPPPSPPRIRIYFNTPPSLEESQPKNTTNGTLSTNSNRAKRKMSEEEEEEEEEGRRRRTKLNPTSEPEELSVEPQIILGDTEKDRDSVAPSVEMSATASVSGRTEDEGDWLMEAIGHDPEPPEDIAQESSTQQDRDEDDVDAEGEDDPDAELADVNHVKEHLDLPTDAPSSLESATNTTDAMNEDQTLLNDEHESQDTVVHVETSFLEVLPATHPLPNLEEDTVVTPIEVVLNPSTASAMTDLPADTGPEPEPPASPVSQSTSQQSLSQTLNSSGGSFSSMASPSNSQTTTLITPSQIPGLNMSETPSSEYKLPSANRVSISYASGARRLLIDAQIVETMKIWRGQGRIEILLSLERECEFDLKGLIAETYSQASQSYTRLQVSTEDDLLPPWPRIVTPSKTTLRIYLDKDKPMTEPRWVKTGDVEEWLRNTFGIFWVSGDDGWEKRIEVVDPDPPSTIHTVLENWTSSSLVGLEAERQRFVKTYMSESDNMLEVLLRLVRGERATPLSFSTTPSSSNLHLSGPLLTALSPNSPHASQQTHLSLAIVAMVRMAESFAERAMPSDEGKREVGDRVGEIIRCLPQHLLYKSLDGIFREWKDVKKRGGRG
ncbi:hypothetical protein K439DRAFT_13551 [Ramaria rubella]|nr:hypothetical protein K439DRAFT_13551 [Ramaria rubella]